MAIPVRPQTGATSVASEYDELFADEIKAEQQQNEDPKITYDRELGDHYEGMMRGSAFEDMDLAPTQFQPKEPVDPEVDIWDDIKAAPTAAVRGFTQGMAITADLIPTTANALGEYALDAYDVVTGNADAPERNLDDVIKPWALSGLADETLGTTDSYEIGAISEIAGDVGEAAPMLISMGAGMQRYGANMIAQYGTVNPMFANYTMKFAQSLGIDMAAITAGETMEEVVEYIGAEEDGVLAIGTNVVTSILGGWKLSQVKALGATDEAIKKAADDQGVRIGATEAPSANTVGDAVGELGAKGAQAIDLASRPLEMGKKALTGAKDAILTTGAKVLDNLPFSKSLFREFKEQHGTFSAFLKEQKLMDYSNKGYMGMVMEKAGPEAKKAYFQNLEVANHLNLKLDTYQLTGRPEFKRFSQAVAKLNPEKTLANMKHNLDMIDDFLNQKNLGHNEASNNALQLAMKKHHGNTEEALERMRAKLIKERDAFIMETKRHVDPVKTGEDFLSAFNDYERAIKDLVGKGFEKAIPKDTAIDTKFFNNHVLTELTSLKTDGIIPANIALPKVVRDMMEGTATQTLESGVKVTPKISAREMHESIVQLKKARKALIKGDPAYNIKDAQLVNVIGSMEDTLAQKLTPKQFEDYQLAKKEYHQIIGDKFNQQEVKKFTLKDGFNKLKSNGQELLEELLNTQGASESRLEAISKLLTLSHDDMMKMAHRIDDTDVNMIDDITAAQDVMQLKIKNYVVDDYMTKLLMNPDKNPVEFMDEYASQHGRLLTSIMNEPFDLGKMAREVQEATANNQARIDDEVANMLDIGAKGERKLDDWIQNDLIKNANETKRFIKLLEDPEKLKAAGMVKKDVQDVIASKLVDAHIKRNRGGMVESSDLFRMLDKNEDLLVDILGRERVEHMRSFDKGFGLADSLDTKALTDAKVTLEQDAVNKGIMKKVQQAVSTRLMIAHGFVSPAFAYSMAAIRTIGGLKSKGHEKFMTRMMTDPEFFQDMIETTKGIKNHDDIIRARLTLAHLYGIPTDTKDKKEADEQARSLMDASISLENSAFKDLDGIDAHVKLKEQEAELKDNPEAPVEKPVEAPVEAPVETLMEPQPTVTEPTGVEQEAPAMVNVPEIPPSDPTNAVSTRKSMKEIRGD